MSWISDIIQQGSQDIRDYANIEVDRRNRDHNERREDRLRRQDRVWLARDRRYDNTALQRMRRDAEAAGIHPLAVLGGGVSGPVTSFQSQSYGGGGTPSASFRNTYTGSYGSDAVDSAQARLLNSQADLVEMQIEDSRNARIGQGASNDRIILGLGAPAEETPQTRTPVIEHYETDPTVADAQSKTTRYGEAEMLETALAIRTGLLDYLYQITGKTRLQRRADRDKFFKSRGLYDY